MKNLWDDSEAETLGDDLLAQRVYSSRLLGREPALVLHGGGNTSVKATVKDLFGNEIPVLYVKGSGWDLATIEAAGFAPVRLDILQKMAELEKLSDSQMVDNQRAAMLDPNAPNPSVEAILHAIIPFRFVDHSHSDATVTLSNTSDGETLIRQVLGEKILIIPYLMPGFDLAKAVYERSRDLDWDGFEGIMLMNHGLFTYANDAKTSYTRMIEYVSKAEEYLKSKSALDIPAKIDNAKAVDLLALAELRAGLTEEMGAPVLVRLNTVEQALSFACRTDAAQTGTRGPLTPDHVIRTKRIPLVVDDQNIENCIAGYAADYQDYFDRNRSDYHQCLDRVPRWAIWPQTGTLAIGRSNKEVGIISDIVSQTTRAIERAEKLDSWKALDEKSIFDVEYWELEQAKLKKTSTPPPFLGKVALVTGAASGIGRACAQRLLALGASVVATDINPDINSLFRGDSARALAGDVTDKSHLRESVEMAVRTFGGLDILVSNAGVFPQSCDLEYMKSEIWNKSLAINLTSHQQLMQFAIPYMRYGSNPCITIVASKNVPAPGPGQAAYSVAKAGITQLVRVSALELGKDSIRVNAIHPNAVFDTGAWTDDQLLSRAKSYGLSVDEYKSNNVLATEVTSNDVAELVCAIAGPAFAKITGAQIPIDGGNDRVI